MIIIEMIISNNIPQLHFCVKNILDTSNIDESKTEAEKKELKDNLPPVVPLLKRYGYEPDQRRIHMPGLFIDTIQSHDTNDQLFLVIWSDYWKTNERAENLIENRFFFGYKQNFLDLLRSPQYRGRPFKVTGAKVYIWCIPNYKQNAFGFCTVHCVNNFVDYSEEQYAYFTSQGPFLPLSVVITKSMSFCKGKFSFEKYPTNKRKCFCSENVYKHSCYHAWLLEQRKGKYVIESDGHCYSWDSDAQLVRMHRFTDSNGKFNSKY